MFFKVIHDIHGVDNSIRQSILMTAGMALADKFGIDPNTYIFTNEKDVLHKYKDVAGNQYADAAQGNATIKIKMEESPLDSNGSTRYPQFPFNRHFFNDAEIGASIHTLYDYYKAELTFRYEHKSESLVAGMVNRLRTYASSGISCVGVVFELIYALPAMTAGLISHINGLKNLRLPSPIELSDYISSCANNTAVLLQQTNGDKEVQALAVREFQHEIILSPTEDLGGLKYESDTSKGLYYFDITYTFTYMKPVNLLFKYPWYVFNTQIDNVFVPVTNIPYISNEDRNPDYLYSVLSYNHARNINYYTIPTCDDSLKDVSIHSYLKWIMVIQIIVDPNNPKFIGNLNDLGNVKLRDCILHCALKSEGYDISILGNNLVYMQLYKNGMPLPDGNIELRNNGDLYAKDDMDIKSTYHLVISILTDLTMLTPKGRDVFLSCIKPNGIFNVEFAKCMMYIFGYDISDISDITEEELCKRIGICISSAYGGRVGFKTVQLFTIELHARALTNK